MVGSLISPFQACVAANADDDIPLDELLEACRQFKDVVARVGQKSMSDSINQNLVSIAAAKTKAPKEHQTTLRALLEYEKTQGVRPEEGGKLKDASAALALLWMRRSLAFQHRFNEKLVQCPNLPAPQAAMEAYEQEVERYHSWGLKNVFKMALRSTTPARAKALAQLRGSSGNALDAAEEAQTLQEMRCLQETMGPLLEKWKSTFESLDLEDDSKA